MKATMFFVWNVLGFLGFFFDKCKKKLFLLISGKILDVTISCR